MQVCAESVIVDEPVLIVRAGGGAARSARSGDGDAEAPGDSSMRKSSGSKPAGACTRMVQSPQIRLQRSTPIMALYFGVASGRHWLAAAGYHAVMHGFWDAVCAAVWQTCL